MFFFNFDHVYHCYMLFETYYLYYFFRILDIQTYLLETIPLDSRSVRAMVVMLMHGLQEIQDGVGRMGGVQEMDLIVILDGVQEME